MLSQLGIFGWEGIELPVLATLLSDNRPLFIGDHGSNKTEGSRQISLALLGPNTEFRNYEVPILNPDDLFGYPNPQSIAKGKLEFVDTPLSVWGAQSLLLDEINRASPFVQGKLHELVRTKKLMGMDTKLEFVFSAINPPGEIYDSNYMGLALASRFVCIEVPGINNLGPSEISKVIAAPIEKPHVDFSKEWKEACKAYEKNIKKGTTEWDTALQQITRALEKLDVSWSVRQMLILRNLLVAARTLQQIGICESTTPNTLGLLGLGTVPQVFGITAQVVDRQIVQNTLVSILGDTFLRNSMTFSTLLEVFNASMWDPETHFDVIQSRILSAKVKEIKEVLKLVKEDTEFGKRFSRLHNPFRLWELMALRLAESILDWRVGNLEALREDFSEVWEDIIKKYGTPRFPRVVQYPPVPPLHDPAACPAPAEIVRKIFDFDSIGARRGRIYFNYANMADKGGSLLQEEASPGTAASACSMLPPGVEIFVAYHAPGLETQLTEFTYNGVRSASNIKTTLGLEELYASKGLAQIFEDSGYNLTSILVNPVPEDFRSYNVSLSFVRLMHAEHIMKNTATPRPRKKK